MSEELVMRSVYLRPTEDSQLRQLAHEFKVTKSDLIRSAISVKLKEWLQSEGSVDLILHDLTFGRRDSGQGHGGDPVRQASAQSGRAAEKARALTSKVGSLDAIQGQPQPERVKPATVTGSHKARLSDI
jgi:hypothetical protein